MNRSSLLLAAVGVFAFGLFLGRDLLPSRASGDKAPKAESDGAKGKAEKHVLTTAGTGSVRFKPDSARVFLRVDSQAPDIVTARAQNNQDVKKVMDALRVLKIPNLKMKSDNITVAQVFERKPSEDKLARVIGYTVSHHFTTLVENDDVAKLSEYASRVLDTALANGANNLQQILIFRKDHAEFRRQALTKAVEDALANARALAAGANKTILDTTEIAGEPQYAYALGNNNRAQNTINFDQGGGLGADATPVMAGDLEITCRVNLTCRY